MGRRKGTPNSVVENGCTLTSKRHVSNLEVACSKLPKPSVNILKFRHIVCEPCGNTRSIKYQMMSTLNLGATSGPACQTSARPAVKALDETIGSKQVDMLPFKVQPAQVTVTFQKELTEPMRPARIKVLGSHLDYLASSMPEPRFGGTIRRRHWPG